MANFHLEIKTISRTKGSSITSRANYISGHTLRDHYLDKTFYHTRDDVRYAKVFLPPEAPEHLRDLGALCQAVDRAERRRDARTGRILIGSLPNELTLPDWIEIVDSFIQRNFLNRGLCAVAAIHHGKNTRDMSLDNPHVHIIVPTRTVGPEGFLPRKDRTLNRNACLQQWRADWAMVQNRAYERNGLSVRVSHERLTAQGILDREPIVHLSHRDWQREQRGERTRAGDRNRQIRQRSQHWREQEHTLDRSR